MKQLQKQINFHKSNTIDEKKYKKNTNKALSDIKKSYDIKFLNEVTKLRKSLFFRKKTQQISDKSFSSKEAQKKFATSEIRCISKEASEEFEKASDPLSKSSNYFLAKNISEYDKNEGSSEILGNLQIENDSLRELIKDLIKNWGFYLF